MSVRVPLRWWVAAFVLVGAEPAAADATYLQVPGLTGPAAGARYAGWFEVSQESIVLLPGVYDPARQVVTTRCLASIRTQLGAAGSTLSQLVGSSLGTLRLERVASPDKLPLYEAALRNVVLTQHSAAFDAGGAYDVLSLTFDAAEIATYQRKSDGSRASGTQGAFNCLLAP